MGTTLNSVENLGLPFRSVDEQVFVIPSGQFNEVRSTVFKINFIFQGAGFHEVAGGERVRFEPGDIFVLPRICTHRYYPLGPRDSHRIHALRLVFDPTTFPPFPATHRRTPMRGDVERDFASYIRHHLQEARHLPQGQDAIVGPLLTELRQEAELRATGYRFRVTAILTAVLVQIVRQISRPASARAEPDKRGRAHLVLHAREYLRKNLDRELHLDQVAGHLHVSVEHLARVFKQETGQTVFTHLQQLRLEKAKTYLIGTDKTISAIARLSGFSSVSLFSRTFKRAIGTSPLRYRQERWDRAVENR
jgi:AraC-like DNA-binding protein